MQGQQTGQEASLDKPAGLFFQILLVDDEEVVRDLLRALLNGAGYTQVDEVDSGEAAVAAMETCEYHLVMLDKNLPKMSGLDVLKQSRGRYPNTEFIIMTGYGSVESAVEALDWGAHSYITKPFSEIALVLQRVSHALDRVATRFQISLLLGRLETFLEQFTAREPNGQILDPGRLLAAVEMRLRSLTAELRQQVVSQHARFKE